MPQEGSSVFSLFSLIKLHFASLPLGSSYSGVAVSSVFCAQNIYFSAQTRGAPFNPTHKSLSMVTYTFLCSRRQPEAPVLIRQYASERFLSFSRHLGEKYFFVGTVHLTFDAYTLRRAWWVHNEVIIVTRTASRHELIPTGICVVNKKCQIRLQSSRIITLYSFGNISSVHLKVPRGRRWQVILWSRRPAWQNPEYHSIYKCFYCVRHLLLFAESWRVDVCLHTNMRRADPHAIHAPTLYTVFQVPTSLYTPFLRHVV